MNIPFTLATAAIADVKAQALGSLFGSASDFGSLYAAALMTPSAEAGALHAGRNMALSDPESAYRMMTLINDKQVCYKAQFSELSQMGAAVAGMQQAGLNLGGIAARDGDLRAGLQDFVGQYNVWMQRFNPDMQGGGLLADTRAAQLSRYELEQSVTYLFNGANDGLHGLGDLGIAVELGSGALTLDAAKLDAMLASNRQGVVNTIREFGANFAKTAALLNAERNFIPSQLDNLNRAIRYIDSNHAAWQAEFGTGAAARPAGQTARALAAYNQAAGI